MLPGIYKSSSHLFSIFFIIDNKPVVLFNPNWIDLDKDEVIKAFQQDIKA